jgi:hypothetical protein
MAINFLKTGRNFHQSKQTKSILYCFISEHQPSNQGNVVVGRGPFVLKKRMAVTFGTHYNGSPKYEIHTTQCATH